ncbi:hypothetical protein SAMN05518861_102203 [Mesorhizobium sp. YR577]|nr:hypothetical protein SAMN05518861_102203 [Mesorhizobium sp. YR577]
MPLFQLRNSLVLDGLQTPLDKLIVRPEDKCGTVFYIIEHWEEKR